MSFADAVKSAISDALRGVHVDLTDRQTLLRNLVFVYHCIKASEHLLEVAIGHLPDGDLRSYYRSHLEEERSHEQWLAADLLTAGIDVKRTPVPREAVEIVGSQYYFIFHVHPISLLGYMAKTECFPVSLRDVEALEAIHGQDLLRTVRYHAVHDLDHGNDIEDQLDLVPEHLRGLVMGSAVQSALYFAAASTAFAKYSH